MFWILCGLSACAGLRYAAISHLSDVYHGRKGGKGRRPTHINAQEYFTIISSLRSYPFPFMFFDKYLFFNPCFSQFLSQSWQNTPSTAMPSQTSLLSRAPSDSPDARDRGKLSSPPARRLRKLSHRVRTQAYPNHLPGQRGDSSITVETLDSPLSDVPDNLSDCSESMRDPNLVETQPGM